MHHSECSIELLDLGFNRLTDAGARMLCDALCASLQCATELALIVLGGNAITPAAAEEIGARLKARGPTSSSIFRRGCAARRPSARSASSSRARPRRRPASPKATPSSPLG